MQASGSRRPSLRRAHELLGVPADADAAQIARAYRRQARRLHPDVSVEPNATERFSALQAAYRVAVGVAQGDGPQLPAQVAHHDPVVGLGVPVSRGFRATAGPDQSGVAWLAAGPVQVRPPQRPNPGNAPRTEPGIEPGTEPETTVMSSGEGP
jgi:hypothetical protein